MKLDKQKTETRMKPDKDRNKFLSEGKGIN